MFRMRHELDDASTNYTTAELDQYSTPVYTKCRIYEWMTDEGFYQRIRDLYDAYDNAGLLTGWQQKRMLSELRKGGWPVKDDEIRQANQCAINEWFDGFSKGGLGADKPTPEPMRLNSEEFEDAFEPNEPYPRTSVFESYDDDNEPARWQRVVDIDEQYQPRQLSWDVPVHHYADRVDEQSQLNWDTETESESDSD